MEKVKNEKQQLDLIYNSKGKSRVNANPTSTGI